jgi:hypothetical protein
MSRVAIVGSRSYSNLEKVDALVEALPLDTIVISGGAKGVDRRAEAVAVHRGMTVLIYKPDWELYGKAAGPIRNGRIVDDANHVVAFYNGTSIGTADMIRKAKMAGKRLTIIGEDGSCQHQCIM